MECKELYPFYRFRKKFLNFLFLDNNNEISFKNYSCFFLSVFSLWHSDNGQTCLHE